MFDVCALGEILIDFTPCGISPGGQRLFEQNPGGAPANVLAAMNRLGAATAFIGKVGRDMHGFYLRDVLNEAGICTDGLIMDDTVFTTLAFVALNEKGERSFSFARKPGADTMLTSEELREDIIKSSRIFHAGSLSLTGQPCRQASFSALKLAKEHHLIISYDPNYRRPLWKDEKTASEVMRSVLPFVDVMKLSDEETLLLSHRQTPEDAAEYLVSQGIPLVVVTLGSDGAYVCTREGGRTVPGFASKVADTTGAGDSFWGGFLYQLSKSGKQPCHISLAEAVQYTRFANGVASLCVEKRGAIPAMPTLPEVLERIGQ